MYKQRSKRTGTKESRKARYEKRMELQRSNVINGRQRLAEAGSKRNKHLPKNKRYSAEKDWNTLIFPSDVVSPKPNGIPGLARQHVREMVNAGEAFVDHSLYSKPNHASRAVSIDACFPPINAIMQTDDVETMLDKINAKLKRVKG